MSTSYAPLQRYLCDRLAHTTTRGPPGDTWPASVLLPSSDPCADPCRPAAMLATNSVVPQGKPAIHAPGQRTPLPTLLVDSVTVNERCPTTWNSTPRARPSQGAREACAGSSTGGRNWDCAGYQLREAPRHGGDPRGRRQPGERLESGGS